MQPWNAIDRRGHCAGEYALANGHQEVAESLLAAGCRAELILAAVKRHVSSETLGGAPTGSNDDYLQQSLAYSEDQTRLMDADGEAVMMEWEGPLMKVRTYPKIFIPSISPYGKWEEDLVIKTME